MHSFLLSIITINYNNDKGLLKTIKSVTKQEFKDFEYIIIDGNSNDFSKSIIEEYKTVISYSVSEKDNGIYHAMNKGIAKASGKYLLFLNSGDELYNSKVLNNMSSYKTNIVYFNVSFYDSNHTFTHIYPSKLNFNYFLKYSLPHQATLIERNLFNKVGLYDESLKICSDWAFFVDAIFKHSASYKKVEKVFSKLDRTGISCDPKNKSWIETERLNFLKTAYPQKNLNFVNELSRMQKLKSILKKFAKSFF